MSAERTEVAARARQLGERLARVTDWEIEGVLVIWDVATLRALGASLGLAGAGQADPVALRAAIAAAERARRRA